MLQIAAIGVGAGAASALLFASIASGSLISVLLFYLAPLPILIAALGWSHLSALIAAFAAAGGLALALGGFFFPAFLFGVGLPAWWLGYLALLARPLGTDPGDGLDWYPIGRLAFWAAILGAMIVITAIPTLGLDEQSFRSGLRRALERMFVNSNVDTGGPAQPGGSAGNGLLIDVLVSIVPPSAAVLSTVINIVNLWLAGRVVKLSGRLRRPWPDLAAMRLPVQAPAMLAVAAALCFLPGLGGIIAGIFFATLLMLFGILGLAVLHSITRGLATRGLILSAVYAALFILGWPMLLLALFGLIDVFLDLRERIVRKRGPPPFRT